MHKKGGAEIAVLVAFAILALGGLSYTLLRGGSEGMAYRGQPYESVPLDPTQFQTDESAGANGLTPTEDQPNPLPMLDCQSSCFGTQPGTPDIGQEQLGGSQLKQCLAACQSGTPFERQVEQECYTCSCPSEKVTEDDPDQALVVCKRVCGADATVSGFVKGPCTYT